MKQCTEVSIVKVTFYAIATFGAVMFFASNSMAQTANPLPGVLNRLTVNSMAGANEAINTTIPAQAQSMFGGLSRVNCAKGQSPASCLPVGFLDQALGMGQFTPASAAAAVGKSLTGQETLAQATPWLGQIKVSDALAANPQLQNLLPANAFTPRTLFGGGQLKSNVANLQFGSVVDLTRTKLDRVPSLANTAINKFQGYQKLMTDMIPNLGNIAIANMPKVNIPAGMAILKMDAVRTKERNVRHMVMSGSDLETSKECLTNCDYIETMPIVGLPYLRGARIISGDSLQVRGGHGLLAWVNGGKEPTGIHFIGDTKFVIRNVNGKSGRATVNLNFRGCFYFFGKHCTPYFAGFPLWQLSEKYPTLPLFTDDANVSRVIRLTRPH
jgi:hypothetical protein